MRASHEAEEFFLIKKNQQNNKVFCFGSENCSAPSTPLKFAQKLISFVRSVFLLFLSFYLRMSGEHGKLWHFLPFSRRNEDDELALPMTVLLQHFKCHKSLFVPKLLHLFSLSGDFGRPSLHRTSRSFQLMERINPLFFLFH